MGGHLLEEAVQEHARQRPRRVEREALELPQRRLGDEPALLRVELRVVLEDAPHAERREEVVRQRHELRVREGVLLLVA